MNILLHLIVSMVSIGLASYLLPGVTVTVPGAFILAIVLGILNLFIRPVIGLIALPITVLTLGIFSFVLNALFIMLSDYLVDGFMVDGSWWAFLFAIVLSLVHAFFHLLEKD